MNLRQELLSGLPSVDEVLKSQHGVEWLKTFPRRYVLEAIREVISLRRKELLAGVPAETSVEAMAPDIEMELRRLSALSLRPVINATGIVIHTNLGRAPLSEKVMENVKRVATGYSNLEYDLDAGRRGKRYVHIKRLLKEVTDAEDGVAVNNNAAAVLLCLNTIARGKEVIVSRGELVEIGGSFRIPDVMALSGAILREVGTTNKTHLYDYENAINENTALILKIHQSNYRMLGFVEDVPIERLIELGQSRGIPVMYDLGSGCLIDLKPYGIHTEPSVQEVVKKGADLVSFSGDKLLGGPQAGVVVGKREMIERIQKNPLMRAVRIDKLTLSALEATLVEYVDIEKAKEDIPTIRMLLQELDVIKRRAKRLAAILRRDIKDAAIDVIEDSSHSGGGSLPEVSFPTFAVSIKPQRISVNHMEERLRRGEPPVIARIKENSLIVDARTLSNREVPVVAKAIRAALR